MYRHERGPSTAEAGSMFEAVILLIALIVVIVFFILPSRGVVGPQQSFYSLGNPLTDAERNAGSRPIFTTGVFGSDTGSSLVAISQGNAAYTIQPGEEYIMLENRSDKPLDITGWKLENAKGSRTYEQGGNQIRYASDSATIPQAVGFVNPSGFSLPQDVILAPGEQAVITTGSMGVQSPYKIVSFKENECSGYLESLPQYSFSPSLNSSCALPTQEPGYSSLSTQCKNLIQSIGVCQTPVIGSSERNNPGGLSCDNCVNGQPAPSDSCLNFIESHYNYASCVAVHQSDPNFYSNTWRIFLGRQWEMWGDSPETISLFDRYGNVIATHSY